MNNTQNPATELGGLSPMAFGGRRAFTRRGFLKSTTALAGSVTVYGALAIGQEGRKAGPPSERIRYALIGCGGQGNAHLDALSRLRKAGVPVEVVAVSDVYTVRLEAAMAKTSARGATEFQRILDRKDIDAIGIATPDHWHASMSIAAAESGKDVYCEKPMTHWHDLTAPAQVAKTIVRTKRVMQVGTQGMSDSIWEQISEHVKAGKVGKLVHAQASDMRNGYIGLYDPKCKDAAIRPGVNLDWNRWLGPAAQRPWDPGRYLAFRCFWDYSAGVGTDFLPHLLTPLVRAMNLDFPRRVSALGGVYAHTDGRETPDIYNLVIEYPTGPTIYLAAGVANGVNLPMVIRGTLATVYPRQSPGALIRPEETTAPNAEDIKIERTRGESLDEHYRDFLSCVKSRQQPRSNAQLGVMVMAALNLGILAFRSGKAAEFDAKALGL